MARYLLYIPMSLLGVTTALSLLASEWGTAYAGMLGMSSMYIGWMLGQRDRDETARGHNESGDHASRL